MNKKEFEELYRMLGRMKYQNVKMIINFCCDSEYTEELIKVNEAIELILKNVPIGEDDE